jgi:hypothetical protein
MFSRQQVAELMEIKDRLAASWITVVAIGSGTPEQARLFVVKTEFDGEMYVDQDLLTFRAFNLVRGFLRTVGPAALWHGLAAMKKGFQQGRTEGDLWQQGGVFVMGPGRQMIFQHRSRVAGDHADPSAVLKVALKPRNTS